MWNFLKKLFENTTKSNNYLDIDKFLSDLNSGNIDKYSMEEKKEALVFLLEKESLNYAHVLMSSYDVCFNEYTLINLIRDKKRNAVFFALDNLKNLSNEAPPNFIGSALALSLIDKDWELLKALREKGIEHDGLMFLMLEREDILPLTLCLGIEHAYDPTPDDDNFHRLQNSLLKKSDYIYKLRAKVLQGDKNTKEFLNFLLFHFPRIYFEIDIDFLFRDLNLSTKTKILEIAQKDLGISFKTPPPFLKGLNKDFWFPNFGKDISHLPSFIERIYGEKPHRPLIKLISNEIEQGDFRWINCLYWSSFLKTKIPQDILVNNQPFHLCAKSKKEKDSFSTWSEEVARALTLISNKTSQKQFLKILSTLESQEFYLRDVKYYLESNIADNISRFEGNSLREIHDELGLLMLKAQQINFSLKQDELHSKIHQKTLGQERAKISVPLDLHDLLTLGNTMKICVGTSFYGRACADGEIFIVVIELENEKDNLICVEYKLSEYSVVQARSFYNKNLDSFRQKLVSELERMITVFLIEKERSRSTNL